MPTRERVLRLTMAAGEAIPSHDDRAGVLVCIAGCRIRFTMPDARRITHNLAAGPVEML